LRSDKLQGGYRPLRKSHQPEFLPKRRNASTCLRLLCAFAVIFAVSLSWLTIHLSDATVATPGNDWEEAFFRANQAYKEGKFQDAAKGYGKLLDAGHKSGDLYYNLGNAELRRGELGRAILAYERARILMPRDADLNFNLRYALDQRQDAVQENKGMLATAFFWLDAVNMRELFLTFAGLNVIFWMMVLLRLFNRSDLAYYLLLIVAIMWAIGGISFGLKWYQAETDDRAIVLPKEVSILAGPDDRETVLFKLHSGTFVHQERSEDGWALVRLTGDKRGWTKDRNVERVRSEG
jgi:tetratricopeptide (TPR) repeat protein